MKPNRPGSWWIQILILVATHHWAILGGIIFSGILWFSLVSISARVGEVGPGGRLVLSLAWGVIVVPLGVRVFRWLSRE